MSIAVAERMGAMGEFLVNTVEALIQRGHLVGIIFGLAASGFAYFIWLRPLWKSWHDEQLKLCDREASVIRDQLQIHRDRVVDARDELNRARDRHDELLRNRRKDRQEFEAERKRLGKHLLDLKAERDEAENQASAMEGHLSTRDSEVALLKEELQRVKVESGVQQSSEEEKLRSLLSEKAQEASEWKKQFDMEHVTARSLREDLGLLTAQIQGMQQATASAADVNVSFIETFEGKIWNKKPDAAPPFLPKARRKTRIISVVNLKGGVGKTTVTGNLGVTLAKKFAKRVLLVDLDYQGSLTSLCLDEKDLRSVRQEKRFVERLLAECYQKSAVVQNLDSWVSRIQNLHGLHLLATEEPLADLETQLMVKWFLQGSGNGKTDVRFLLRSLLHVENVDNAYDLVLLDCPPRLTTACINAIACSDYVLIPVLPDERSTEAVPRLLLTLQNFRKDGLCPDLSVLGVLANRTDGSFTTDQLAKKEKPSWMALPPKCLPEWHDPVYFFKNCIKQFTNEAIDSIKSHRFVIHDKPPRSMQPTFGEAFEKLAEELIGQIR